MERLTLDSTCSASASHENDRFVHTSATARNIFVSDSATMKLAERRSEHIDVNGPAAGQLAEHRRDLVALGN